ncbi:MAG: hypothetical protein U0325_14265 [Polyangiales bacterium]
MKRARPLVVLLLALGCGTLEQDSPLPNGLPNNRTGPFRVLDGEELEGRRCVVEAPDASLEDPDGIFSEFGEITLVMTRVRSDRTELVGTTLDARLQSREGLVPLLPEVSDARAPALARDARGWLLVYARAANLELAFSDDGRRFRRQPVPLLVPDLRAGESQALGGPSLTQSPDGGWWLAYESGGSVWLARAATAEGPYARVDTDSARVGRQPVLEGSAAQQHANPAVRVERTSTGRTIWRVYATTRRERVVDGGLVRTQEITLAASWDGARFTVAGSPALSGRAEPSPDAPSLLFANATQSWMLVSGGCGSAFRGVRAAVYPAEGRLPVTR